VARRDGDRAYVTSLQHSTTDDTLTRKRVHI
jgi:hypothetical protein